jgi:hypothetical protein
LPWLRQEREDGDEDFIFWANFGLPSPPTAAALSGTPPKQLLEVVTGQPRLPRAKATTPMATADGDGIMGGILGISKFFENPKWLEFQDGYTVGLDQVELLDMSWVGPKSQV